jgi:uncharacterized protein (TIGR03066 family)
MTRKKKILLGFIAVAGFAAGLISASIYRSAVDQKRLIGTWTLISGGYGTGGYGTGGYARGGATLEFSADGKMKVAARRGNKTVGYEVTYKVKGDRLEMTTADDEESGSSSLRQQVVKITSLSDRELIVADEKGRKRAYSRK